MRRVVEKMKQNNKKTTFFLQLTAMVDMFTILIVFLLKSFSTSAVHITPHDGLRLPYSSSYTNPVEALRLVISTKGIFVDNKKIVDLSEGKIDRGELDPRDPDFIRGLYEALDKQALKSKDISITNKEHKFTGTIIMQADAGLEYSLLKKVMYTSSLAGYADMKLATISE